MIAVELNKNRQMLVWRPHLLTEVAEGKQLSDFLLEPVLDPPELKKSRVELLSDETTLQWDWGNWNRVEIWTTNPKHSLLTYIKPQTPEITWRQLPPGSELELTFHGSNGVTSRAKVQVPDEVNFGRDVVIELPINGTVRVGVAEGAAYSSVEVHWLQLDMMGEYRPKGTPIRFPHGKLRALLTIPNDFFGILAVVATQHNARKLIAAADYTDNARLIPHTSDNQHLRALRRYLRSSGLIKREEITNAGIEEWLGSWPDDSQRRLRELYEAALKQLAPGDAGDLLRRFPTGLFRYLVLQSCGLKTPDTERLIQLLNDNDFKIALKIAMPALAAGLEMLTSPAERAWAIQHADHAHLIEAATEAANHGRRALARSLHLVEKRHEAIAAWKSRRKTPSF